MAVLCEERESNLSNSADVESFPARNEYKRKFSLECIKLDRRGKRKAEMTGV